MDEEELVNEGMDKDLAIGLFEFFDNWRKEKGCEPGMAVTVCAAYIFATFLKNGVSIGKAKEFFEIHLKKYYAMQEGIGE